MWNEEQAALIPTQLGPTAVDSEHVMKTLKEEPQAEVLQKCYVSIGRKHFVICLLIYSYMVIGIFELV